ncbi:MAG: MarR family winged helix-turn-helix transcriptional regulator [Acidimicrobiia bacterium]|nr:winged helix-turn-helix transcriptional regulator [Acidimicrobiia bacterium]MCL4292682.1 MarR family winged helix-turn-helix transcriptional regulator [Acidimicrobiia bacterium]
MTPEPSPTPGEVRKLTTGDFERLLGFRTGLRRFLHWSQEQARAVGITPAQHQLMLAVRGFDDRRGPNLGDLADLLLLRHHSAVELVDRAEAAGLVRRRTDPDDHRVVRVRMTSLGTRRLNRLAALHLAELDRIGDGLDPLWSGLPVHRSNGVADGNRRVR